MTTIETVEPARVAALNASRLALVAGASFGACAVALGAFGAHALRGVLDGSASATWHIAVDYQFRHALALLALGAYMRGRHDSGLARSAAIAFIAGVVLFCGSLYALACGVPRVVGVLTPFGGGAFLIGWLALAWQAWRDGRGS